MKISCRFFLNITLILLAVYPVSSLAADEQKVNTQKSPVEFEVNYFTIQNITRPFVREKMTVTLFTNEDVPIREATLKFQGRRSNCGHITRSGKHVPALQLKPSDFGKVWRLLRSANSVKFYCHDKVNELRFRGFSIRSLKN